MALREVLQQLLLAWRQRGGVLKRRADVWRRGNDDTACSVGADGVRAVEGTHRDAGTVLRYGHDVAVANEAKGLRERLADLLSAPQQLELLRASR